MSKFYLFIFLTTLSISNNFYAQEKPTAENTGYTGELTEYTGRTSIVADGTVIENKLILGTINLYADNVTIRNCKISTAGTYGINTRDAKDVLIEDCEIEGMQSAAILGSNFIARRCHIWNSGADGIKPYNNFVIEACYFHSLGYIETSHADGIQMVLGGNGVITGNNFDMEPTEGYKNSQAIIIQSNNAPVDNVTISGNWINGGGYSIQVRDREDDFGFTMPTNITISDNLFGRDAQFGNIIIDGDVADTNNIVSNNRYEDNNELVMENNTSVVLSTNDAVISEVTTFLNPVVNELHILGNEGATYELYSNSGGLILKNTITTNNFDIKTNTLSSGIYFMKIFTEKGVATKKIIKK